MKKSTQMAPFVAFLRAIEGLTQQELGDRAGWPRQAIADIERGKVSVSWEDVEHLLKASGTDQFGLAPMVARMFVRGMGLEVIGQEVVEAAEKTLTSKAYVAMGSDP